MSNKKRGMLGMATLAAMFAFGAQGQVTSTKFHDNKQVVPVDRNAKSKQKLPFAGGKLVLGSALEPKIWDELNQRQKRKLFRNNPSLRLKHK